VSYSCRWIDFENLLVTHADENGFPAIQAMSVNADLGNREEPAHGQRFESSLSVPLLFPFYSHKIIVRCIREWRPGLDVICLFNKPAGYGGVCCLALYLPGLFGRYPESFSEFGKVRCPSSLQIGILEFERRAKEAIVVGQVADVLDLWLGVVAGIDLVPPVDLRRGAPRVVGQIAVNRDSPSTSGDGDRLAGQRTLGTRWCRAEQRQDEEHDGAAGANYPLFVRFPHDDEYS